MEEQLRRIDITLERLDRAVDELPAEQQVLLVGPAWFCIVATARIRAMERAEEAVRPAVGRTIADVYDRVVQPGERAVDALKRTFHQYFARPAQNGIGDDPVTTP